MMHNDLMAASDCVKKQVWRAREAEAEVKEKDEALAANNKALDDIEWPPDFEQWMEFCDAFSGSTYSLSRALQSLHEDTYTPACEEAKGLMAGWEPALQDRYWDWESGESCRRLFDSVRERARAKFESSDQLCVIDDPYHSDSG